ncbi:MAG: hypothetical protein CL930_04680 [Deltaproteobacteria bacterium]|nr:hypothetical protein [Deltaproteobacteria bacterium]
MEASFQNKICVATILGAVLFAELSIPSIDHPLGSDWGHYFTVAEYLWHPNPDIGYPDFRKPWFGWLMGALGEGSTYLDAAQFLGRASALTMIVCSGILAWALAGRWSGGVAAWVMAGLPLVLDGALWVNHYPLLGAAIGLAFAAGAAASRWRGWWWVTLSAAGAGASLVLDMRGSVAVPVALMLVLLGSLNMGVRSALMRLLLFGGIVASFHGHDNWLQTSFKVPQLEFEQQLKVQRKGTLGQIRQGTFDNSYLQEACANQAVTDVSLDLLQDDCAVALRGNSYRRLTAERHLPNSHTLWLLPLVILPFGATRLKAFSSVLASGIVFTAPLMSLLVGMGWVTYFDRYVLPFAVVLGALVPVAFGRVAQLVGSAIPRVRGWFAFLFAVAAAAWCSTVWPGIDARGLAAPEESRSSEYHAGVLAKWALNALGDGDGILDCAGLALDSLILPKQIDYMRYPPGDPECAAKIQSPAVRKGKSFLITMHRDYPQNSGPQDLAFNVNAIEALGWQAVNMGVPLDGYMVWVK